MISIIISSVNEHLLNEVKLNISQTIGETPFEIIAIENSDGARGICEVYNLGAQQARYDILCFIHEDIKIYTENWGDILREIFEQNERLGLIGVAGGQYKSLCPSGWSNYELELPDIHFFNIVQNYKFSGKEQSIDYRNPSGSKLAQVACLDGVWLCCRKSAVLSYPFDQDLLRGFHGYDLDFCLGVGQSYHVAVTFDILIEHYSDGNFGKDWLREILKVHAKWSHLLPVNLSNTPLDKIIPAERRAFRLLLKKMFEWGFSLRAMLYMIKHSGASNIMTFGVLTKIYKIFIKYVFRKRPLSHQ